MRKPNALGWIRSDRLLALLFTAVISACAMVRPGDPSTAERLKNFEPARDWVSLYVCREQAYLVAAGVRSRILVDNKEVGVLKTNMFAHVWLQPGMHGVLVRNDGLASGTGGLETFEANAGDVVYYWVGVTGKGFGTLTVDKFDSATEARACVTGAVYAAGPTGAAPPDISPTAASPSVAGEETMPAAVSTSSAVPPKQIKPMVTAAPSQALSEKAPVAQRTTSTPSSTMAKSGQDSHQVERMTEVKACATQPRAELAAKGPGYEAYKIDCHGGDVLMVRCEFGSCRVLR